MEPLDFILFTYSAFNNKVSGKTMLQKRVYFLGVLFNNLDELGYKPHYYGPYSPEVAHVNDELKSFGYVEESISNWGISSSSGFEIIKYDFKLTPTGINIAGKKKKEFPKEWEKIQKAAERIKEAGDIDYMSLSIAAKAYYILKKKEDKATLEEIRNIAEKFGWIIQQEELGKAVEFLEKTKLVSKV